MSPLHLLPSHSLRVLIILYFLCLLPHFQEYKNSSRDGIITQLMLNHQYLVQCLHVIQCSVNIWLTEQLIGIFQYLTENHEWTFWPTQYLLKEERSWNWLSIHSLGGPISYCCFQDWDHLAQWLVCSKYSFTGTCFNLDNYYYYYHYYYPPIIWYLIITWKKMLSKSPLLSGRIPQS